MKCLSARLPNLSQGRKSSVFSAYITSDDCAPVTRLLDRHSWNVPAAPRPVDVRIDIRSCVGGQTFWLLNCLRNLKKTGFLSQYRYKDLVSVISVCFDRFLFARYVLSVFAVFTW